MEQKVERKPLLSDGQLCDEVGIPMEEFDGERGRGARWIRVAYEKMIDRGELVIPKTAKVVEGQYNSQGNDIDTETCSSCGGTWAVIGDPYGANTCPICGARIID